MYERYWNLKSKPFSDDHRPEHFYCAKEYREAITRLLYAVAEGKTMFLLGGPGSGKTFLLSTVVRGLRARGVLVGHITSPASQSTELVRQVALTLGMRSPPVGKAETFERLSNFLQGRQRRAPQSGCRVVVAIDDADGIADVAAFEELRLLSNLETTAGEPLTSLLLTARPALLERLGAVPGLLQRAALVYHLPSLSEEESQAYIRHRFTASMGDPAIFEEEALKEMCRFAQGNARLLNHICDLCLLLASSEEKNLVDRAVVQSAKGELKGLKP